MTLDMVLTGVDLVDGQHTQWKVENSWGEKVGEKGVFVDSDAWFDTFVDSVVITQKYLPAERLDDLQNEYEQHTVLAPWELMGALAYR